VGVLANQLVDVVSKTAKSLLSHDVAQHYEQLLRRIKTSASTGSNRREVLLNTISQNNNNNLT